MLFHMDAKLLRSSAWPNTNEDENLWPDIFSALFMSMIHLTRGLNRDEDFRLNYDAMDIQVINAAPHIFCARIV